MRLVLAAALAFCAAPAFAATQSLALNPADTDHNGVVSPQEAAAWLDRDRGVIVPVRLSAPARAAAAAEQRRTMFDQGLLRPNDFRAPPPEQRPPEDLFYKDFTKIKK
ncbi:MAG: hypothetical protein J7515_03390 [Caulobacter sp.]|nr:hypothetical protein [Caulobacter sp.]